MELRYAFLATAAEFAAAPDGRLALIGGDLDTVWSATFPVMYPSLAVVVKLWVSPDETGREHALGLSLKDMNGSILIEAPPMPFVPQLGPRNASQQSQFGLAATLMGLPLPAPGEYRIDVTVDGEKMTSLPLHAAATEERAG